MADEKKVDEAAKPEDEEQWVAYIEFIFEAPPGTSEPKDGEAAKDLAERAVSKGLEPLLKRLPENIEWSIEPMDENCVCRARKDDEPPHKSREECEQAAKDAK